MSSCHSIMSSCHSIMSVCLSIMSSCHSIMSVCNQLCLLVIQLLNLIKIQLCLLVIQLCSVLIQSVINYVFLSFDFVCLLFNYIFLSRVEGRGTEHVTVNSIFDMKTASYLMCWIGRITGTYSDVNEENVIQTCCTDNILRPKKSLKWPVSQFHLAHYSSTNVCLKNWTTLLNPSSSCGTTRNRINSVFSSKFCRKSW